MRCGNPLSGAWSERAAIWFVVGTISLELSRERGRPVLQMRVCDRVGTLDDSEGVWSRDPTLTSDQIDALFAPPQGPSRRDAANQVEY